jgi:acetyltransferase-like isoleucine patch superfamily enzyme
MNFIKASSKLISKAKTYGLLGSLNILVNLLLTKFLYKNARLIRRPYYIRGRQFCKVGKGFTTGVGLRLDCFPVKECNVCVEIGDNVQLNDYVHIGAINSIKIGNNVLIASKVFITDHNHGSYGYMNVHSNPSVVPQERDLSFSKVVIEDNVWIGELTSILPGVTISEGSIIGAMSLVNKDIPPYSIAVGIPAKVIKRYNFKSNLWEKV